MKRKVKYVGHVVSGKGIEIDQGKTDKVVNWPTPTTPEDVRRFLGFVGYYRHFIHNFSKISRPLTDLIPAPNKKKKSKSTATREWKWDDAQQQAFHTLKRPSCQCSYPRICQQLLAIRAPYRRVRGCPGCCFVSGAGWSKESHQLCKSWT